MAKNFWFKFYYKDWSDDVKPLSLSARGLLIELIIYMRKLPNPGYMPVDIGLTVRLTGGLTDEIRQGFNEFKQNGIFDFEIIEGVEHIVSRKIAKEHAQSIENQKNGLLGGNPSLIKTVKGGVNRKVNRTTNSNSISIFNNKKKEEKVEIRENVFLTLKEIEKLKLDFGEGYEWAIDTISNYKFSSGKKYKSDYHALIGWVKDKYTQEKNKTNGKFTSERTQRVNEVANLSASLENFFGIGKNQNTGTNSNDK